jgi:hypothetical protein
MVTPDKFFLGGSLPRDRGGGRIMGSLSNRHVPLLFRMVFNLDTQLLHTRRLAGYPLSDTKHTIGEVPFTCLWYLAEEQACGNALKLAHRLYLMLQDIASQRLS